MGKANISLFFIKDVIESLFDTGQWSQYSNTQNDRKTKQKKRFSG